MKALVIEEYGGPENFKMQEVPEPGVGESQVLIENYATSVNPIDWKVRAGMFKDVIPIPFPIIIGHDVAGIVRETGTGVTKWKPGDRVFAKNKGLNSFAEFVAVDEDIIAAVPESITFQEAASVGTAGVAAYKALFHFAHLTEGQKVLIHGGAGGVGSLAVQLAKNTGAYVASTVSTTNIDFLKNLGVDQVIDYTSQDFTKEIIDCDLVVDLIGGDIQKSSIQVVRPGGTLVTVSGFSKEEEKPGIIMERLRAVPDEAVLRKMMDYMVNKELKPIIEKVLPFDEEPLQKANGKIETGHGRGKMVVQIKEE